MIAPGAQEALISIGFLGGFCSLGFWWWCCHGWL